MNLDAKYWEGTCLSTVYLLNYFPRVRGEILKPLRTMMASLRTVMTQSVILSLIHIFFRRTFQRRICIYSSLSSLPFSTDLLSDAILPHSIHSTQWEKNFVHCISISITRFKTTRWYLRWGIRSQGTIPFYPSSSDLWSLQAKRRRRPVSAVFSQALHRFSSSTSTMKRVRSFPLISLLSHCPQHGVSFLYSISYCLRWWVLLIILWRNQRGNFRRGCFFIH